VYVFAVVYHASRPASVNAPARNRMVTPNVDIRLLTQEDLDSAMRLKEAAGWNQTADDWRRLLRHDPGGCFAAVVYGNVVATTTTTTYGPDLAWVGMVLVDPRFRRHGLATRLVDHALEHLDAAGVRTVKLDATPEGRSIYERAGFQTELMIERWAGVAPPAARPRKARRPENVRSSIDAIRDFDRRAFGADRSALLTSLAGRRAPITCSDPDGRIRGYASARRGSKASYVGPVVADCAEAAAALFDRVLARVDGEAVYVDVNTTFDGAAALLADRGFRKQRDLIRMRRGEPSPAGTSSAVFAIAGPEVG
jgi:ribosomal protein S18 acetylase RimI-like enzyme